MRKRTSRRTRDSRLFWPGPPGHARKAHLHAVRVDGES